MVRNRFSEVLGAPVENGGVRLLMCRLTGFVGFALAYAFTFAVLFGSAFMPAGMSQDPRSLICRALAAAFGCLAVIAFRACGALPDKRFRRVLPTASMFASLAGIGAYYVMGSAGFCGAAYACWAVLGIACGACYYLWSVVLGGHERNVTVAFMAASNILAVVLVLAEEAMVQPAALGVAVLTPMASLACNRSWLRNREGFSDPEPSRSHRGRLVLDGILNAATQSFGFGLGISCLLLVSVDVVPALLCCAAVASACALILVDWRGPRFLSEDRVIRYLPPIVTAGGFLVSFLPGSPIGAAGGFALAFMTWVFALVGCCSEAESSYAAGLNLTMALSRDWCFSLLGAAMGMAVGSAGYFASGDPLLFPALMALGVVFLSVANAVSLAPGRSRGKASAKQGVAYPAAEGPGTDAPPAELSFDERCLEIAQEGGLSARQTEVMMLLARGRDSKFIQEKLIISRGTADTHVYNIYRKLDIHSKQELIDLIEERS